MPIRMLPEEIINQISAGEVVQNPASVVKELVENSIDSGATEIYVLIKTGGKELISVIDNGDGMNEVDLIQCTKNHATSKIQKLEDIYCISSLGMRERLCFQ